MKRTISFLLLTLSCLMQLSSQAQFTLGNLVVLQAGDGSNALSGTGNTMVLREFNLQGQSGFSTAIPSTGTTGLLIRGSSSSEGYISRSADNKYIVFGGYMQTIGGTLTLNSASPSTIKRGIGLVNESGNFILAASSSVSAIAAGDIRGATATNSSNVWSAGSSQGTSYFGTSANASNVQNSKPNLRATHIFNNQLYISSPVSTGTPSNIGIFAVGSGTPTSSAQTVSTVINTGNGSQPGQFYFNLTNTICYVADARSASNGGGIQKWVYAAGSWSLAYTIVTGTGTAGAFAVVANFSGIQPMLYATTTESSNNRLIAIRDVGVNSTFTNLATASQPNTIFRGLAFSPTSSTCVPVSILTTSNSSPACSNQTIQLGFGASGTGPFTYSWTGSGSISNPNTTTTTINNASSGIYTFMISNSCGTAAAVTSVTAYPTPTVLVNNASMCIGGNATLIASGAQNYSWTSNGTSNLTGSLVVVSPTASSQYSIVAQSNLGCITTTTAYINVINGFTVSLNSSTICEGDSTTIQANGAINYSWNTGAIANSILVYPIVSTIYTVTGAVPGCTMTVSNTSTITVNQLPQVNINSNSSLCLQNAPLMLNGSPAGGTFSGIFVSGVLFSPTLAGTYSISYNYIDTNTCSNSIQQSILVSNCAGVKEGELKAVLLLYPNPVINCVYIELQSSSILKIYDVSGKIVAERSFPSGNSKWDLSFLIDGLYFMKQSDNHASAIKFVKH